jgi:hydroxyacylglutathione hydrolase
MGKGKAVVIDTRSMLAFGGGHIDGALNIAGLPELSIWAGWMLDPEKPILLVLERDDDVPKIVPLFLRTGYTKFAGYLVGGMKAWDNAGFPLGEVDQMTVHEVKEQADELQILDVRSPDEWKKGHIPGAKHIFLPEVPKKSSELNKKKPIAVYCDSGYRASLAASILKKEGFVAHNVPGSWQAWKNAKYPVEKESE